MMYKRFRKAKFILFFLWIIQKNRKSNKKMNDTIKDK
jgi:hypothetical protein